MDAQHTPFDTRSAFQQQLALCIAGARHTLCMFDPDFACWELGSASMDAALRRFLHHGGQLQLVAHQGRPTEQSAPRFLRLIKDYQHRVAVRRSHPALRQLHDSFCLADQQHLVRRFHSDHYRGIATANDPFEAQTYHDHFITIWLESGPGLYADTLGI